MPFLPLEFKPGIMKEGTASTPDMTWYDCDKIRFRFGFPEKIGGWEKYNAAQTFQGTARSLFGWTDLDGANYFGMGTHLKYYIMEGQFPNDITPIRKTTNPLGSNPIATGTIGSGEITITDTAHGAAIGDFVTISGATTVDGITTGEINTEHQVIDVPTVNSFIVDTGGAASSGSTSGGGASVVAAYQIGVGLDTVVYGTGWGAGTYGREAWGSGATSAATGDQLRLWTQDNFGEDLIFNPRDSGIYYWDTSSLTSSRGVSLSDLAGADGYTPTLARQVMISDEDRHVIAFGCDPLDDLGTQDTLLVRWGSSESVTEWLPDSENTAGDFRINGGSEFVTAVQTRQEIVIWTDRTMHSMRFTGAPFTFGQKLIASNIAIMSPNAFVVGADNIVYFMGVDNFYSYSGRIQPVPCTVRAYVFDNMNRAQRGKVTSGQNRGDNEIWWFYPRTGNDENSHYVVYNYLEQLWYVGSMARTAWIDHTFESYPIAAGTDGYLYYQEKTADDGSTNPVTAIDAYIESAEFEPFAEGHRFAFCDKVIPNLTFDGSDAASPSAEITISAKDFPGAAKRTDSDTVTQSSSYPETYTERLDIRTRGRSLAYKIRSNATGVKWRQGQVLLQVRPDGGR